MRFITCYNNPQSLCIKILLARPCTIPYLHFSWFWSFSVSLSLKLKEKKPLSSQNYFRVPCIPMKIKSTHRRVSKLLNSFFSIPFLYWAKFTSFFPQDFLFHISKGLRSTDVLHLGNKGTIFPQYPPIISLYYFFFL